MTRSDRSQADQPKPAPADPIDFFVSHAPADQAWAEWIAGQLEAAGYTVRLAGEVRPGENIIEKTNEVMRTSRHTLGVVSPAYLTSQAWTLSAGQYQSEQGKDRALIPVQVEHSDLPPLLAPIKRIDLVELDEDAAARLLLEGVEVTIGKPRAPFPGGRSPTGQDEIRFPADPQEVFELREQEPVRDFVGRDELLFDLYNRFRSGRPTASLQVLIGLGGIGKTKTAVEYAYRHGDAYDVVWWVHGEKPAILLGEYLELASRLGLPVDLDNSDLTIATLRQELGRRGRWLLIFDNIEDSEFLRRLLPQRHRGHILITTRLANWPNAETPPIDVLEPKAAVEFLRRRAGVTDVDAAARLAEALGYLPLALAQAAALIKGAMTLSTYLELLESRAPALFAKGKPPDYEFTVASTWNLSLERLEQDMPAAVALLRLCSFLGGEAIPLSLIAASPRLPDDLAPVLRDPFDQWETTNALITFSLADRDKDTLSIHRLVQAVVRAELVDTEVTWAEHVLLTIFEIFPTKSEEPDYWDRCESLLPHALAVAAHAKRLGVAAAEAAELLVRVVRYLRARGRLGQSRSVVNDAIEIAAQLGDNAPIALAAHHTLGRILFDEGDVAGARAIQEEVYERRRTVLGKEHPDTLRAGRDLIEARYRDWNLSGAHQLLEHILALDRQVLGEEHPETISVVSYQATMLYDEGRRATARSLEEWVLDVRRRLLGEEHPDTLSALANLASTIADEGDLGKARALEERVLDVRRRLLGEEHPDTLNALANLASVIADQGEFGEARALQEQVVDVRRRLLGEEHPDTLVAISSLSSTLHQQGELDNSRELTERVLDARRRLLGGEHPDTLTALTNLMTTIGMQGDLAQAREVMERVVDARRRLFGENHPSTLNTLANLAGALHDQGELDEARALEEQVLDVRRRLLGEEHPDTLSALANLAHTLRRQGERKEARSLYNKTLLVSKRRLGPRHPLTTECAWGLLNTTQGNVQPIIVQHLGWLRRAPSSTLSSQQRAIKARLFGRRRKG
jgi:tetratricopeptide (TPR) repeat protein